MATLARPPSTRPGVVERTAILDRIAQEHDGAVLAVVAPAGYGKTTLLRQWSDGRVAATTWLGIEAEDDDPTVLVGRLAMALREVLPVDPDVFAELAVESPSIRSISRALANLLASAQERVSVVVDDVHLLTNPACHDVVSLLVAQASPDVAVALGSREALPVPVSRLRAHGVLVEVGPADLAMDVDEASQLAAGIGRQVSDDVARDLVSETEGWPVALYLVVRSGRHADDTSPVIGTGRRRPVVEYLRDEFLQGLDADAVEFLTRSSVLRRLSGRSCDAVLGTVGSAARLERYAHSNLLVVPLDDERGWYRYHHVFHQMLRAELDRREPDLVPELLDRAAAWCESQGLADEAMEYAMASGDVDRAAGLMSQRALALYRSGRSVTLARWLDWFDERGGLDRHPQVAAVGAWTAVLNGQAAVGQRWAAAAEASRPRHPDEASGDEVDGLVDLMRAMMCREGIPQAFEDVERARRILPVDHPWRPTLTCVAGVVRSCTTDVDGADRLFADAVELAEAAEAAPAHSVALAERALLALARDDLRAARHHVAASLTVVETRRLQDHSTNVLVFAVAARVSGAGGSDPQRTRDLIARAQRLRPLLNHAIPHLAVQARLALARALLTIPDGAGARTVVREIDEIRRHRPGLGALEDEVAAFRPLLDTAPSVAVGASTLTTAELRVLPLLQTHLNFREIGDRLYVSPNTIKTQAISVYRKLGVSSRSDAVARAIEIGLIE